MKWISYFFTFNIPFYIYKLKTYDSMIEKQNDQDEQSLIILHGIIYLTQIFSNKEVLPITVLQKNHIIDITQESINKKSYYKITALKDTYLMRFANKHIKNINFTKNFFKYYIMNYKSTLSNQKIMHYILIHKQTHYRIVQFIILLSIKFGIINEKFIKIPFKIRKRDIALMTGANIDIINKTFNLLKVKKIIQYSRNQLILIQKSFFIDFIYLLN